MSAEPRQLSAKPHGLFLKHILRKIFLEDWTTKLLALAITIGLWSSINVFTKQGSARFTVPLNIRTDENTILTGQAVKDVTIRVNGDDQKIRELLPNDIRISLDLNGIEPGEKIVTISPKSVDTNLPGSVRLEDIQPQGIPVKLEAAETKDVLVEPVLDGTPKHGYEVYNQFATPQLVTVRGPASYIGSLESLATDKIDVTDKTADFSIKQVPLKVTSDFAMLLKTAVVDVNVRIGERRVERSYLVAAGSKKATVVLFGPPTVLNSIKAENIHIEIDPANSEPNVILPESVRADVDAKSVTIRPQ